MLGGVLHHVASYIIDFAERMTKLCAFNPVIPVRDMAAALAYYTERLGFRKSFDDASGPDGVPSYAGVCRDGLCLHLQTIGPDEAPTMPLIRIEVQDIEALHDEYQAQGIVASPLAAKPWGTKDFGVYDLNKAALVFYEVP